MKINKAEFEQLTAELRKMFPVGSTVYTIVRSVSRTGMSREISVLEFKTKVASYLCATCGKPGPSATEATNSNAAKK